MTPQFPNPWLADSEWLLSELTKAREQILKTLRYLPQLHREGQRSFAKQSAAALKPEKHSRESKSNIVRIRA